MNLPVITHPMSQVGDRPAFSVQGQSQLPCHSHSRQGNHNFVSSSLPLLSDQRKGGKEKKLHLLIDRKSRDERKGKFQRPFVVYSNLDELEALVQEKVTTGLHGVKCMFKANDPSGLGTISREAFFKILCNLVGYVSVDQFSRLLRRLGLETRASISFEDFMMCYKENEHIEKEWIIPLHIQRLKEQDHWPQPEKGLREDMTYRDGFISVPLCLDLLKQKVRQRGFRMADYLPNMRQDEEGRILPPQLAQFLEKLGLMLTEEDFRNLWGRYDMEGVGAIKMLQFFKMLGLDESGTPRPTTTDSFFSLRSSRRNSQMHPYGKARKKTFLQRVIKKLDEESQREASVEEETTQEKQNNVPVVRRKKTSKTKRVAPKLDNVVDALKYKFEQSYQAMLKGMQCFDVRGEGLISRVDLQKVLEEFGFPLLVMDVPQFLTRCGVKAAQGEFAYTELIDRFWNRSEAGFVHRLLERKIEQTMLRGEGCSPPVGEKLTVDELEQHLVEFIHRHFITLSADLRKCDYNHLGVLPQYEFRAAIEKSLGHQMSESQWSTLKDQAAIDGDGLVPYRKFLETFLDSPGAWNKREYISVMVRKVPPIQTPSVVERLRARAQIPVDEWEGASQREEAGTDRRMSFMDGRTTRAEQEERSPEQLTEIIQELFRKRFYEIDKAFRELDRKMTGRFNKQQFGDLLKKCDIELSSKEVNSLWAMVETSSDNMVTFSKVVSHFAGYLVNHSSQNSTGGETSREGSAFHKGHSWVPSRPSTSNSITSDLLRLIRADASIVVGQWDKLRRIFKHLDKTLSATVSTADMKEVMKLLHFNLTEEEMEAVVGEFDLRADGSFHYIEFMKNFAKKRTHHIVNRISAGYLGRVIEVTDGDVGHGTEVSAGGQGHSTERGGFVTKTDSMAGQ
ncbi:hypothetical protein LSAT2_016200 [Lamellibrachia satsuma]|nr:hypothetical protein LSAT2_016200 [Lamellibrachia satsuma]